MPKNTHTPRSHTRNHTKRHGQHHKKTSRYVKIYAPYLPLVISIIASVFLNFWQPTGGNTLAYATNMSASGLLGATNSQRASNGKAALSMNAKLSSAAQAKANDMIARNYWSHNTPDGKEPWVFIQGKQYDYVKAGENLAYGFATSVDAVAGWMNSPTHKANMLDASFTEVGFGYANGSNFNSDGQQTVVVAMYGQPQVLSATAPSQSTSPTPAPAPTRKPAAKPIAKPPAIASKKIAQKSKPQPVTTEQPVAATMPVSQNISKAQTLTNGRAPWALMAALLLTGSGLIALLLHHSLKARHLIHDLLHNTERFILHHPLLDSTFLGLTILGTVLSRTVGTIL